MDIKKNIHLAPYTTFHIGGPADFFVFANSTDDLTLAISWARGQGMPFFVLGQGANILVSDRGFRGLVIKNDAKKVTITDTLLTAESGVTIAWLIEKTSGLGLSGLEHFAGIPSSLGGALWQNLHFLSSDRTSTAFIATIVASAQIFTESGEVKEVAKDYFQFAYDYSILHDNHDIVLSAKLQLEKKDPAKIRHTISENIAWRNEKHPFEAWKKSAGSVFKKIEGHGSGRLIEKAGLKGKRIGGAQISEQHANFILNVDHATANDVRALISLAQAEVKKTTGLQLETEISFIGEY